MNTQDLIALAFVHGKHLGNEIYSFNEKQLKALAAALTRPDSAAPAGVEVLNQARHEAYAEGYADGKAFTAPARDGSEPGQCFTCGAKQSDGYALYCVPCRDAQIAERTTEQRAEPQGLVAIINEVAACTNNDPNRGRTNAGRWVHINMTADLWERISAAARASAGRAA